MLTGLQLMTPAELIEVAKLTGVNPEESPETIRSRVVAWIAGRIQCSETNPEAVERAALEKIARDFGLTIEPGLSTDDLERNVRLKIATDAVEYLSPAWRLACALVAMGPPEAVPAKLKLLQRVSSLAVPSSSTSQQLLQDWNALCQKRPNEEQLLEELKPAIAALRAGAFQHTPEKVENALTLALVISLADGRFSLEEEKLFRNLGAMLGREPQHCDELLRRVNSLYWNHQMEASPTNPTVEADLAEAQQAALKAAEMTLGSIGALEGLVMVARDKVIASQGGPTAAEPAPLPAPKSGWQKLFGSLSGMKQFVQTRVATEDQTQLVRLVYLAIVRQHVQALAERDARALEAEQMAAQQQSEAAKKAEAQPEAAPAATAAAPRRAIKMDP